LPHFILYQLWYVSVPYLRVKQASLCSVTSPKDEELIHTAAEESKSRTVDLISLNKAGNQFKICCGRSSWNLRMVFPNKWCYFHQGRMLGCRRNCPKALQCAGNSSELKTKPGSGQCCIWQERLSLCIAQGGRTRALNFRVTLSVT